jgi:hypothetical protein
MPALTKATAAPIDVIRVTAAFDVNHDLLEQEVRRQIKRRIRAWQRTGKWHGIDVTDGMAVALTRMYRVGVRGGKKEAKSLGVNTGSFGFFTPRRLTGLFDRFRAQLTRVNLDVAWALRTTTGAEDSLVRAGIDVTGILENVGIRRAVAGLLPEAYTAGLADTFEAAADAFDGWEYTSVLDGGTCDQCRPHDGERYRTLEDAYKVLPNFGPNPECRGGWRCRCRLVPVQF